MSFKNLKRNYFLIIVLVAFVCFMAWLLNRLERDMMKLDSPVDFNEGWQMEADASKNTVVFSREISKEMLGRVVCFYAYDSFVDATADGEAIYHYGESRKFLKSPGTLWHMITVPADALGGTLAIKLQFAYDYKFTTDIRMMLGSSGAVVLTLLRREALDLVVNIAMFILGIILCTVFFLELKNKMVDKSSLYLGLLSIGFVLWTNNSMFFTQMIFPYGAGQYFAYYFFLFMLPLLLMCYLETIIKSLKFNYLFCSHMVLVLVLTVLQLTGTAEFTETLSIFLVCSAIELLIAIGLLVMKRGSQGNRRLLTAFVTMVICIIINAILFFLSPTLGVSTTVAKLGISFYLLVSIYDSFSNIITDMAEAKQTKALRKIAFTDSLTGVGNRYAFNNEIDNISLQDLALFSLDINNLKYYNDTYGHACGDTLICKAIQMMNQVFKLLYRTGGDEFIAISSRCTDTELADMKRKLGELMLSHNLGDPEVLVEIACGYSGFKEGDVTYEDILRRADAEMYKDKVELKKTSKIKSIR